VILIVGLFLMVTFFVWWQGGGVERLLVQR
jgi:hypothetical protein